MTQVTTDVLPAPVAVCALRVARLDATGATPAGATNGYCTKRFAKLTFAREVEAGVEILKKNACGDIDVNFRERDMVKRWNVGLELTAPDPELEEMMTQATLITKALTTTRTFADGVTTTGSSTVSSPALGAFTQNDLGSVLSGAGIPVGSKIIAVLSSTQIVINGTATATGSAISLTITAAAISVGNEGPALGVRPTDFGVSVEMWMKNVRGGVIDPVFPWRKVVLPASFWNHANPADAENAQMGTNLEGFAVENPTWGNGPFNDWGIVKSGDAATTLTTGRPMSWHYTQLIPATQIGYVTVPAQV